MKRIFKNVAIVLLCGAMIVPAAEARGRNGRWESPQRTHAPASRPGNMGQGNGNNGTRPSTRPTTPSLPSRPGGGNNGNHNRPGNNNGNHNRPGNSNGNHNRPSNNNGNHNRPGNPGGPIGGHRPDYRPQPGPSHRPGHHGPMRPNIPPHHGWHRPVPPPHWRPAPGWRPFRSILGITFGTTINLSVNALMNNGYVVNSYGNNSVYVSNVPMLNMMWPDAVLYYDARGGLCGSRFVYSSGFYDMNRYNMAYASLVNGYGAPVSVQNSASGIEATWWGAGNQFIRLAFSPEYTANGSLRYFTTLSFGN